MEKFVVDTLEQMLKSYPDICTCEQCMSDIVAWSLNHLPPKYVGTDIGDAYARLDMSNQEQYTQVVKIIAQSIELVSRNPHHAVARSGRQEQ